MPSLPSLHVISDKKYNQVLSNNLNKIDELPDSISYVKEDSNELQNISKKRFRFYRFVTIIDKAIPFLRLLSLVSSRARNIIQTVKDVIATANYISKIQLKNQDDETVKLANIVDKKHLNNPYATTECLKSIKQNNFIIIQNSLADENNDLKNVAFSDNNEVTGFSEDNSFPPKKSTDTTDNNSYTDEKEYDKSPEQLNRLENIILEKHKTGDNLDDWITQLTFQSLCEFDANTLKLFTEMNISEKSKKHLTSIFNEQVQNRNLNYEAYFNVMLSLAEAGFGDIEPITLHPSFINYIAYMIKLNSSIIDSIFSQNPPTKDKEQLKKRLDIIVPLVVEIFCNENNVNAMQNLITKAQHLIEPNLLINGTPVFISLAEKNSEDLLNLWVRNFKDDLDFNKKDKNGETALFHATMNKNSKIVELLCNASDNLQIFNTEEEKKSPIVIALISKNKESWKILVKYLATNKNYSDGKAKELIDLLFFLVVTQDEPSYFIEMITALDKKIDNKMIGLLIFFGGSNCLKEALNFQQTGYDLNLIFSKVSNNPLPASLQNKEKFDQCLKIIEQEINKRNTNHK